MKTFIDVEPHQMIHESDSFFVIEDSYPVSPGHSLIISKQLKQTFFDLSSTERIELVEMLEATKKLIETKYNPDGYNIGMNCGEAAGQTVMHFHCHIIPRYAGDMDDPRGGVRHCIPSKGRYNVC